MILQDVRRNEKQTHIKYKAYYDKKTHASKLKQRDYVYVLQSKADHQGSEISFTYFHWFGSYIVERPLSNINCLVCKNGTGRTQILHRMRIRSLISGKPKLDVQTTSQEWTHDPEVVLKDDDLYARAVESDFEKPLFDHGQDEPSSPIPREVVVESNHTQAETCSTPVIERKKSPEICPLTDGLYEQRILSPTQNMMRK